MNLEHTTMSRRALAGAGLGLAVTSTLGAGSATARAVDEEPVRIGVLLDTSGPAASHGTRQLLGVQHRADQINAGPGPGVQLLVQDTEGDAETTTQHAQALLDSGIDALIGTSMPWTAQPVMAMAQQEGVPMIVPTTISPPTQPFVFCCAATSAQTTRQTMLSLAAAGLRRAALLILDVLATPERMAIFYQQATASGVDLAAVERFPGSATTLATHLRALTARTPDAILLAGPPPFNAMTARELRALPWPGRLYCSAAAGHPGFLQQAGPAAEGVRVVAPWLLLGPLAPDTLPNSWAIRRFVTTFTPRHGPVGTFAGYGADAVTMIHLAYAGHHDRQRARDTLEHMTHVGVTGVCSMTPANHAGLADNALTIATVRDGRWTPDDGQP